MRGLFQDARESTMGEGAEQVALGRRQRGWPSAEVKSSRYRETGVALAGPNDTHEDKLILASRIAGCTIRTA